VTQPLGRLLFGPPGSPIDRRTYITAGVSLMLFKYLVDAAAIAVVTGEFWTPLDYLLPLITFNAEKVARFPQGLSIGLLLWTLPFIWIGVVLSVRRALDAHIFPGVVVAFFVPFLNYLLMIALAVSPTHVSEWRADIEPPAPARPAVRAGASAQWGVVSGVATGIAGIVVAVLGLRTYGGSVFLGLPFAIGLVSAVVANRIEPRTRRETVMIGLAALAVVGGALLLFALEGAICLAMAVPIAAPIAMMGSLVGQLISGREQLPSPTRITLLLLAVPLGTTIEAALPSPAVRVVMTAIEIDAPAPAVWRHVVSFAEITAAPPWLLRTGLAYPLRARIEGAGVGAVRHCEFTTGAFVEPITRWDEPRVLAFDVVSQPAPLHEWSPYSRVFAPHLDGFFRTSQGEFRLIPAGPGRTRLEGRTWYVLRMAPSLYWNVIADSILHAIHQRVLEHVKAQAEQSR
jgi:hypothetical protein